MQTIHQIITEIYQKTKSKDQLQNQIEKTASQCSMEEQVQSTSKLSSLYFLNQSDKQHNSRSCKRNHRSCSRLFQNQQKIYRKKWSKEEEKLLCNLIGRYGSDFTFLQTYFKNKTRKQLKKKYQQIHKNKKCLNTIQRIQEQIIRQRKKSMFEDQMLQVSSVSQVNKKNDQDQMEQPNQNLESDMFKQS